MTDEVELKVRVGADISDFQKAMKEAAKAADSFQKQGKRFKANDIKGSKDLQKIALKIAKGQGNSGTKALKLEKKLQGQISQTIALMKRKAKASDFTAKSIEKETKALRKYEDQLSRIRKIRKSLGIKTAKERYGPGAKKALRGAAGIGMGLAGGALGAIVGGLLGQVSSSYAAYMQYGNAAGGLVGMGPSRGFRAGRGQRFGYDMTQTAMAARQAGRQTGNIRAVTTAQASGRMIGADPGEMAGFMGTIRRAGHGFTGQSGGRGELQLKKILAAGFESGLERARMPEFISGVTSLVERQRTISVGDVGGGGIAAFMAMLGQTGKAGFQGAAGAQLAGRLDAGIRAPGGGEAGQALALQAFGFGKPGGSTSYVDALRMQEKGLSDPNNFLKVMRELSGQFGGGDERSLAMKNMLGVSIAQADELGKLFDSGKMSQEELSRLKQIAEQSKPIQEQALDQMKRGFGHVAKHTALINNIQVTLGQKIAPDIQKMQLAIQDMIKLAWPAVVKFLGIISSVVTEIRDFVYDIFKDKASQQFKNRIATLEKAGTLKERLAGRHRAMADIQQAMAERRPGSMRHALTQLGEFVGIPNNRSQTLAELQNQHEAVRGRQLRDVGRIRREAQGALPANQHMSRAQEDAVRAVGEGRLPDIYSRGNQVPDAVRRITEPSDEELRLWNRIANGVEAGNQQRDREARNARRASDADPVPTRDPASGQ